MKILSCYIAGFGRFQGQTFEFSSNNLSVLKEDNGWGKTTLADFIKCMLYGLDGGRNKAIAENERRKYAPFNGGAFGGTMCFTCNGKFYRIERVFGKTPSGDDVKIYDENHTLCYDFGERAGKIGEVLFGMDAESYRRSVYIPQGEIPTNGLTGDMKTRLMHLLDGGGRDEGSAMRAMERLEEAERALRAKRRPARGKLDVLEEDLQRLAQEKRACEEDFARARALREEANEYTARLAEWKSELEKIHLELERAQTLEAYHAKEETHRQLKEQMQWLQDEWTKLQTFFGQTQPQSVNVEGLQSAVEQLERERINFSETERLWKEVDEAMREKTLLQKQLNSCIKAKQTYDLYLTKKNEMQGAGLRANKKTDEKTKPRKTSFGFLCIGLCMALLGVYLMQNNPLYGGICLLLGVLVVFLRVYFSMRKKGKTKDGKDDLDAETLLNMQETEAEYQTLQARLENFPWDLEKRHAELTESMEKQREIVQNREKGIATFLSHFAFTPSQSCDLQVAIKILQEKISLYLRVQNELQEKQKAEFDLRKQLEGIPSAQSSRIDVLGLTGRKQGLETQIERGIAERARRVSIAERLENQRTLLELRCEETRLMEEKERLERREIAVKTAKELLLRAQESMAGRYLLPVQENCRKYLHALEKNGGEVCFSSDGQPLVDEGGRLHALDYYSAGERELTDFCTRLAFLEHVFQRELPVLVLDDPFVNLDDKRMEKAKKLVKSLSARYQILYFTCKSERKL